MSVVHLLKAVVALIVTPFDEDGSVVDAGSNVSPPFQTRMRSGKGRNCRVLPGEFTLGAICSKNDDGTTVAILITTGFVLTGIADIKDADGTHEIEFGSADVDVCAFLHEVESLGGANELFGSIRRAQ